MLSFWEYDTYFNNPNITICGGGIVGLSAAIFLKKANPKLKVLILEKGALPAGASTKNAGFACFGSPTELLSDLKTHTETEVQALVAQRYNGLQLLKSLVNEAAMHYEPLGGYEVFLPHQEESFASCIDNLAYLNHLVEHAIGLPNVYSQATAHNYQYGLNCSHLLLNHAEGQIHTGNTLYHLTLLAQQLGVLIVNGIEITGFTENAPQVAITTNQLDKPIITQKLLLANNAFAKQLLPNLPVEPARAQVLITDPIPNLKLQGAFHLDEGYYYFRNVGNRVLLGGGRNLDFAAEQTFTDDTTPLVQNKLNQLLADVILPNTPHTVAQRWVGFMGVGPKKTYIVNPHSPQTVIAVRCGGMGVAVGAAIGKQAADVLLG